MKKYIFSFLVLVVGVFVGAQSVNAQVVSASLSSNKSSVTKGESFILSWNSSGAVRCDLRGEGIDGSNSGYRNINVNISGSLTINSNNIEVETGKSKSFLYSIQCFNGYANSNISSVSATNILVRNIFTNSYSYSYSNP